MNTCPRYLMLTRPRCFPPSQYTQQQLGPHGMMYANVRSTPSPHQQVYGHADLRAGVMVPAGTVYGHPGMSPHPQMQQFHQGGRGGRRGNAAPDHRVSIRSPLLDEFRANKNRKWELKVRWSAMCFSHDPDILIIGHIWIHRGV